MFNEEQLAQILINKLNFNVVVGHAISVARTGESVSAIDSNVRRDITGRTSGGIGGKETYRGIAGNNIITGDKVSILIFDNSNCIVYSESYYNEVLRQVNRYRRRRRETEIIEEKTTTGIIIFKKKEVKGIIVFQDPQIELGDVAILFHVIEKKTGKHPDELCPCKQKYTRARTSYNYSTGRDNIECIPVCTKDARYETFEDCNTDNEVNTGSTYLRWYTIYSSNDLEKKYRAKIPDPNWKDPYDTIGEVDCFIVKASERIDGYDYWTQKWYHQKDNTYLPQDRTYFEWWNVEVIKIGVIDNEFKIEGNILSESYEIIDNLSYKSRIVNAFPFKFEFITSSNDFKGYKVFKYSFDYSFFNPAFNPTDYQPTLQEYPYFNPSDPMSPWNECRIPTFDYSGKTIDAWASVSVKVPPIDPYYNLPSIYPQPEQHHYIIKFFVGGHIDNSLELGSYLLPNKYYYDYLNIDQLAEEYLVGSGINAQRSDGGNPSATIINVGKYQWEVVVSYGTYNNKKTWKNENDPYQSSTTTDDHYWCKKDVYQINGASVNKQIYEYPQEIILNEKNWMAPVLKNWVLTELQKTNKYPYYFEYKGESLSSSGFSLNLYPTPIDLVYWSNSYYNNEAELFTYNNSSFFKINNPELRFIAAIIKNSLYSSFYNSRNAFKCPKYEGLSNSLVPNKKVQAAEAGYIYINPYYVFPFSFTAIELENVPNSTEKNLWGIDADGNQWIQDNIGGCFIDEIKKRTLENIPMKAGIIKHYWWKQYYDLKRDVPTNYFVPSHDDQYTANNLTFLPESSCSVFIKKIFSLNRPKCCIHQISPYIELEKIKSSTQPLYGLIVNAPYNWAYGESSLKIDDCFPPKSFSIKNSFQSLFKPLSWEFYKNNIPYYEPSLDYREGFRAIPYNNKTNNNYNGHVYKNTRFFTTLKSCSVLNQVISTMYAPVYNYVRYNMFPLRLYDENNNAVVSVDVQFWRDYYGNTDYIKDLIFSGFIPSTLTPGSLNNGADATIMTKGCEVKGIHF